jgi:hypothetical protein
MTSEKPPEQEQQERTQPSAARRQELEEYLPKVLLRLGCMDNRELAWWLLNTHALQDATPTDEAIIEEAVHRLYPKWNGRDVQVTEYGWSTPEGDVRYVKQPLTALFPFRRFPSSHSRRQAPVEGSKGSKGE